MGTGTGTGSGIGAGADTGAGTWAGIWAGTGTGTWTSAGAGAGAGADICWEDWGARERSSTDNAASIECVVTDCAEAKLFASGDDEGGDPL